CLEPDPDCDSQYDPCGPDGVCGEGCVADPDCDAGQDDPCGADGVCGEGCAEDPDCV
ncbi:MAG: trypsin, partial [Planctomycetes bacterium]|nr:trypsin [Planctomycetota bacterium]